MRQYSALDITWATSAEWPQDVSDRLLAVVDDFGPTAVEERASGVRIFFSTAAARSAAHAALRARTTDVSCVEVEVPDESWAERSQASLTPVRIGRIVVTPPWVRVADPDAHVLTIQPSMGFGTGHHPSTRLCLDLLQRRPLDGLTVLDVGTGSGVLAIAARALGATHVTAIDCDEDALTAARENVELNSVSAGIALRRMDISSTTSEDGGVAFNEVFGLITANLTGGMLEREARSLSRRVNHAGAIIVSGFQLDEEPAVGRAFAAAGLSMTDRAVEADWVALRLQPDAASRR